MANPRLFLVAPETLSPEQILACAKAACAAGDAASIVVPASVSAAVTAELQKLGLAVLAAGNSKTIAETKCDGVHLAALDHDLAAIRTAIGQKAIMGAFCGASRHVAMQAAEDGADYIALSQNTYTPSEPIIGWWADLFEVPCVAFDPVEPKDLDILLPQNPDFIRPSDAMWSSPEEAGRIIAELAQRMTT